MRSAAALLVTAAALSAQAVSPAVRIVRDPALYDRVWPADLNGDGRADLISSSERRCGGGTCTGPNLQVSLGRGDGTFAAPVQSSFVGSVLNTTDLNGDSRRDVIAETTTGTDGNRRIVVLPGTEAGGQTFQVTPDTGTAPAWLQITRSGDRISASWSANGTTWSSLGVVSIPMADNVLIGLPVTSHNTSATATAVFDDVRVRMF
jgi:hypothetical protein